MRSIFAALLIVTTILYQSACSPDAAPPTISPPWQIHSPANDRLDVFGIQIGSDSLSNIQSYWRQKIEIALFRDANNVYSLEAYVHNLNAGGIFGQLVIQLPATQDWLNKAASHATGHKATAAGNYQLTMSAQDVAAVWAMKPLHIAFIPKHKDIQPATLQSRFGKPLNIEQHTIPASSEAQQDESQLEFWLYPNLGLLLELNSTSNPVFHYVIPADFKSFRQQLLNNLPIKGASINS